MPTRSSVGSLASTGLCGCFGRIFRVVHHTAKTPLQTSTSCSNNGVPFLLAQLETTVPVTSRNASPISQNRQRTTTHITETHLLQNQVPTSSSICIHLREVSAVDFHAHLTLILERWDMVLKYR